MRRGAGVLSLMVLVVSAACATAPPPAPRPLRPSLLPRLPPIQMVKTSQATVDVAPLPSAGPLVASGWCTIRTQKDVGPGCDVGVGIALASRGRLSLVGVVGSKTVGTGIGWLAYRPTPEFPHAVAVAIGIVAPYDSAGIVRKIRPALGATLSLGKGGGK